MKNIECLNSLFCLFHIGRYFRQSKMTSFQRQLNLYGFARLTVGADRGGYYHELFVRGRPDLCRKMVRMRIKGTGVKPAYSPETEPDFYSMAPCPEQNVEPGQVPPLPPASAPPSSMPSSIQFNATGTLPIAQMASSPQLTEHQSNTQERLLALVNESFVRMGSALESNEREGSGGYTQTNNTSQQTQLEELFANLTRGSRESAPQPRQEEDLDAIILRMLASGAHKSK